MALYADENFPLRVIEELRRLGHDVLTAFEDGRANQSVIDQDILARATKLDRAIITLNRLDFKRLHAHVTNTPGLLSAQKTPIVWVKHCELLSQLQKPETSEQN
jgi:predicted nuclease of predicted toxin-antitoxin system